MNTLTIKKSRISVFDSIYPYMKEEFPEDEMKSYEQFKKLFNTGIYTLYTFSDNGFLIGYAIGYLSKDKNMLFLDYLHILKEYQDQGYGSKFLPLLRDEALVGDNPKGVIFEIEKSLDDENSIPNRRRRFYLHLGARQIPCDYKIPCKNNEVLPLDLMFLAKENVSKVQKEDIKETLSFAISHIHSDYKNTSSVIASYLEQINDFIKN